MLITETDRLTLRELTPDDAADLFAIYGDSAVMRFMGRRPQTIEEERTNIAAHVGGSYERHGFGVWGVVLKETGELVGRAGLLRCDFGGEPTTEISYLLGRRHWGKGYATESAAAVVRFAFETLGIDRLVAFINPENLPSIRVARRLGFQRERSVEYKEFGWVELYLKTRSTVPGLDRHTCITNS